MAAGAAAAAEERKLKAQQEKLKNAALGAVDEELQTIFKQIRDTSVLLKRRRRELQEGGKVDEARLVAIQTELNKLADGIGEKKVDQRRKRQSEERRKLAIDELEPGLKVWVGPFKKEGKLVELDGRKAFVQLGTIKATFKVDDLFEAEACEDSPRRSPRGTRRGRSGGSAAIVDAAEAIQTPANTVDLRGMRAEEAIGKLERHLDYLLGRNERFGFVIHGHGTGALKKAVREWLPRSAYVESHRPGERGEGGDGVTVVSVR